MAERQREARIVRSYLEALGSRTRDTEKSLVSIDQKLTNTELSALERLNLLQRRRNLVRVSEQNFESAFVDVAASYSARMGIEFATWREMGVPVRVLKLAGVR
jgi:hypothetical protein